MQICYEYSSHMGPAGLMLKGFKEMYDSGHGCPDTDFTNLGFEEKPTPASIAKARSHAQDAEQMDMWDPKAALQRVRPFHDAHPQSPASTSACWLNGRILLEMLVFREGRQI